MFPSPKLPDKPFTLKAHWYAALQKAGIENFRFHDLRHTAASNLVMVGATLYETGETLGHKSIQAIQRYAHLSIQHKVDLINHVFG